MVVVHTTLWEEDKNTNTYLGWVNAMSVGAKGGYAGRAWAVTLGAIQALRDANSLGPEVGSEIARCMTLQLIRPKPEICYDGDDRPIGMVDAGDQQNWWAHDRLFVLTRAAVERSLAIPPTSGPVANLLTVTGPGIAPVEIADRQTIPPFGRGRYVLVLRVERVP
jgi:hypothetical protein